MPEFEFEGNDIGGDSSEVDNAFAEAFRRAEDGVTPEEPTDEVTPGETPAADEETAGQPRDDQGRFSTPGEEEPEAAAEEVPTDEDPDLAAYLAKYGNDPEKALRAAVELSKLQGRQGDELGQLRSELAAIRAQVERPAEAPRPAVPITEQVVESLDSLAMENPMAALSQAAQLDSTGQLVNRVMDTWFAVNPREAAAFQTRIAVQQAAQEFSQTVQPLVEQHTVSAEDQAITASWDLAKAQAPDIDDHAPAIEQVLTQRPGLAKAILNAETPEERAELFLVAYAAAPKTAVDPEVARIGAEQAQQEAVDARKRATLAKPSAIGSPPGQGEKEVSEEDKIRAGIMGAKSTDIASGFTFE